MIAWAPRGSSHIGVTVYSRVVSPVAYYTMDYHQLPAFLGSYYKALYRNPK